MQKEKSKKAACILWFFTGLFGGHKFYLNRKAEGILYLVLFFLLSIILIFDPDIFIILFLLRFIGWIFERIFLGKQVDEYNKNSSVTPLITERYFTGSLLVLFFLYGIHQFAHLLPPFTAIAVCVLLCFPVIQTLMYTTVITKTSRQSRFVENSIASKLNNGRLTAIIISAISIFSGFSLFLEIPSWKETYNWIMLLILIILFFGAYVLIRKIFSSQVKGLWLTSYVVIFSMFIIPILMMIVYFRLHYWLTTQPGILDRALFAKEYFVYYQNRNPLIDSPSALIAGIVYLTSTFNAFRAYLFSIAAGPLSIIFTIWDYLMYFMVFFSITNILIYFTIPEKELQRNYRPLSGKNDHSLSLEEKNEKTKVTKKYIVILVISILIIISLFMILDYFAETGNFNTVVRKHMDIVSGWFQDFINKF